MHFFSKDSSFLFNSLEHSPVGIMVASCKDKDFEFINRKCREMFNITDYQMQKSSIKEILFDLHGAHVNGEKVSPEEYPLLISLYDKKESYLNFSIEFNGIKNIISMRASSLVIDDGITGAIAVVEDITDSLKIQNNLECATLRLENLWRLTKQDTPSIKEVCDVTLEAIVEITKSKYGFYGFLSEDDENMVIHSWTGETMKGCTVMEKPFVYPIKEAGLWGEAIRQRRPLLVNDYSACELPKRGLPAGHVKLESLMVIPHFIGQKIHSVAAVANKDFGYELEDMVRIKGFLNDVQTVIRRVEAETLLKKSEEKYRNLVELMNEGLLIVDQERVVTFANSKLCQMLGRDMSEISGRKFEHFLHKESINIFIHQQELRSKGASSPYEMTLVNSSEEKVFAVSSPNPFFNDDGEFTGSYEVITDISNIKKVELQLFHSQKMQTIGVLAAGIAHEINTPLQYIIGNSSFIKDITTKLIDFVQSIRRMHTDDSLSAPSDKLRAIDSMIDELDVDFVAEEIPAAINGAIEGLDRISSIVLSVKKFAHPSTGEARSINVNKEIDNTIAISKSEWKYHAEVVTKFDENLPRLLCIPSDFNQLILNVVVNAAHALHEKFYETDSKGLITITTFQEDHFIGISIADNGPGLSENIKNNIFDPFFTTKEVGKGTGMGLAIVLKIIEKHKGKIWFESEEGQGTTFYILFPVL